MFKLKVTEIITYISTVVVINNIFFKISLCLLQCNRRDTPGENFICVCDTTYCDSPDPIPKLNSTQYAVYSTSQSGKRMELTVENFVPTTIDSQADIVIDRSTHYQKIMSFGGAMTDATAINIASLPKPAQDLLMQSYFGENGNNYNLIRVPIAGTDFSTRPYTYDDTPNDTNLSHFQLQEEDTKYKIPYIQQAIQLSSNKIILMGCPWTAPPWMKTNNAYKGGGSLREEYFQLWADYNIKFLQAYGSNGLNFTILSAQNEPQLANLPSYPINGMGWNASGQANWIANYLGPTLKKNGYGNIQILTGDDQRIFMPDWVQTVSQNAEAMKYISGVGVHWYVDSLAPADMLETVHNTKGFEDKWILYSESCEGSTTYLKGVVLGSWNRAETYFQNIIDDLNNWVVGWTDWNMALNMDGGPTWAGNIVDAPIIVDATKREFYKQPMYYAIGHVSRFLPIDSVRLGLQNNNTFVFVVAFQTPNNNTVILLQNTHEVSIPVKIFDKAANKMLQFTMENRSIKTIIY